MTFSRRSFLTVGGLAAASTLAACDGSTNAVDTSSAVDTPSAKRPSNAELTAEVLKLFKDLPGTVGVKIVAPGSKNRQTLTIEQNAAKPLVIGSAFKVFVLAEALKQSSVDELRQRELDLDARVWNFGSQTFNPPHLSGKVTEQTTAEAMIMHSDNTATDMMLKQVGVQNVRRLISDAGLRNTHIPDSTRSVIGYIYGAKQPTKFTWADCVAYDKRDAKYVNLPGTGPQPMMSTADDMTAFYAKALDEKYFDDPSKVQTFRRILSLGDVIWLLPVPLGASAFAKGGSADVPGFHALCSPGAMYFDDQWVYFCLTINWHEKDITDPKTLVAFAGAAGKALKLVKDALAA